MRKVTAKMISLLRIFVALILIRKREVIQGKRTVEEYLLWHRSLAKPDLGDIVRSFSHYRDFFLD